MSPRELRARERVSRDEMARRLGISRGDLRALEGNPLGLWEVRDLARYLGALGLVLELRALDPSSLGRGVVLS